MIDFNVGQIFASRNPMMMGRAINGVQKFWSQDNSSEYSHAGIIISSSGDTFESLWTVKKSHISKYVGQKILVGSLVGPSEDNLKSSISTIITDHEGKIYPVWRLVLHLFPPLAKYISTGLYPVCSELTFKHIKLSGIGKIGKWQGKTPDNVADFIKNDRSCCPIFEGILL